MQTKYLVIRSGGLGDFLLTLPLLKALKGGTCTVGTRRSYAELVAADLPDVSFIDIDGPKFTSLTCGRGDMLPALQDATVLCFLTDSDGELQQALLSTGAAAYTQLESRPTEPPHIVQQIFQDAALPCPKDLLDRPSLPRSGNGRAGTVWVHPGSGSPRKNASLEFFRQELLKRDPPKVLLSFGEADQDLLEPAQEVFADLPAQFVVMPTLTRLRRRLEAEAMEYIGNDSGVTHLAAALGIPTTVVFVSTAPEIWRPPGRAVSVVDRR